MRVKNFEGPDFKERAKHVLTRADGRMIEVQIEAMPFGFERVLERRMKTESPPLKGAVTDSDGKPLLVNGKAIPIYDERDPSYVARVKEAEAVMLVAQVYHAIENDPNISFEVEPPSNDAQPNAWQAFYKKVAEEMERFGLSTGDVLQIAHTALRASNLETEEVRRAARSFLPQAEDARSAMQSSEPANDSD